MFIYIKVSPYALPEGAQASVSTLLATSVLSPCLLALCSPVSQMYEHLIHTSAALQ